MCLGRGGEAATGCGRRVHARECGLTDVPRTGLPAACAHDVQSLGLECRVVQQSTPDGCAAQSVALSPELLLSGWADGYIRCHARSGPKRGAALWSIPSAHATAHASGVPALQFSNRCECMLTQARVFTAHHVRARN